MEDAQFRNELRAYRKAADYEHDSVDVDLDAKRVRAERFVDDTTAFCRRRSRRDSLGTVDRDDPFLVGGPRWLGSLREPRGGVAATASGRGVVARGVLLEKRL